MPEHVGDPDEQVGTGAPSPTQMAVLLWHASVPEEQVGVPNEHSLNVRSSFMSPFRPGPARTTRSGELPPRATGLQPIAAHDRPVLTNDVVGLPVSSALM